MKEPQFFRPFSYRRRAAESELNPFRAQVVCALSELGKQALASLRRKAVGDSQQISMLLLGGPDNPVRRHSRA